MPRLSKIGAAALAAFGWTSGGGVTASYLVVAGGGGGAGGNTAFQGGGGGGGGFQTGTTSLNPTLSYTVTVGAGGANGSSASGTQGSNSQFGALTASVGGGFGANRATTGGTGGSGGGGGDQGGSGSAGAGGSATSGQGNTGGNGATGTAFGGAGGGGGAGAVGGNASTYSGGNGGNGSASSISGSSVTYAGGGGGAANNTLGGTAGSGGTGGGGVGGTGASTASSGTANLGGGGGGATNTAGQGGSGVVIISYVGAQQFGGGIVTSSGGSTIHTFNTSGTLSPLSSLTASYLIVAGGGSGGNDRAGGGGAGGLLSGSGVTIDTNSTYLVTVGAGGATQTGGGGTGFVGSNSAFSMVTTTAVGGGGGYRSTGGGSSANGGSGGGGDPTGGAGTGTVGQGNNGGAGGGSYGTGGGGGASAVGGSASGNASGSGGAGSSSSISGTSTTYAGGGGGGGYAGGGGSAGAGGAGGGGAGNANNSTAGTAGTANTGGGGGGGGAFSGNGGAGGSGIVIISYAGATQLMAGGTVTVSGGNVIHTFTSSGYLTPIVLTTNSLRFRSSASAYLNRTPTTAGNRQIATWSGWIKRGVLSSNGYLFSSNDGGSAETYIEFSGGDQLNFAIWTGSAYSMQVRTTQVFRDPSAWYHIVCAIDTTQATASNRSKIYVNGVQVTALANADYPTQNLNTGWNNTTVHNISRSAVNAGRYFDGYFTEINFIDGQALTPNSFGTTSDLGVWQPIRYGGSYGTNGFYLKFTDTTNTTTLGYDSSPNSNNWTTNNISLTAGTTYDSMTDVPTLTSATAANYCVFNPLDRGSTNFTLSNGNLNIVGASASSAVRATMAVSSGKWYWEATPTAIGNGLGVGFAGDSSRFNVATWNAGTYVIYQSDGNKHINGSASAYGASYTTSDVIGIALDMDAGTITFYKNNVSQGTASTGLTGVYLPVFSQTSGATTGTINANFGAGSGFTYTPPSGFVRLNTFNLPTPTIGATASTTANKYFNAVLYTGNGGTQSVTGVGFQPDMVWNKSRSSAFDHGINDAVRGAGNTVLPNTTNSEQAWQIYFTSFDSDGFSMGSGGGTFNATSGSYVAWNWKANGAGSTNTAGSITSSVSANTTAGFSIVTYTGNGTGGATVGHGLGIAPSMMIFKTRNTTGSALVWHTGYNSNQAQMLLDSTAAIYNPGNGLYFNSTYPSSTVATLGTSGATNGSGTTYVAYMFAQIAGYSAFGTYTGNGSSDGTFIFTGFRPRYVMIKRSDSTADWNVRDTARSPYNVVGEALYPNLSLTEYSGSETYLDILSNGFKLRGNWNSSNASGGTYIYMAFAENPFKYANAR